MRQSGILMPLFSLPSPYGIGSMGKEAFRFLDFLKKSGQSIWQLLPIGQTSFGDSPYQSPSSFAGNPYFIDLDALIDAKLLTKSEVESFDFGDSFDEVDYAKMFSRYNLLRLCVPRFFANVPSDYAEFLEKHAFWLDDYALFCAIKDENGGRAFSEWEKPLRLREESALNSARERLCESIDFYKMVQYLFFKQWSALKKYADECGVKLMGDLPIYVAPDSADLWASPEQFLLGRDGAPNLVAGCPPDAFSEDGQLWGNPLYNWEYMKKDRYAWWIRRIEMSRDFFHIIRIDHFRGFDSFYAIKKGAVNAKKGVWKKGPGIDLFRAVEKALGRVDIIAEDLGFLTPSVRKLLKDSGYPGMKVLQFAFDVNGDSDYLPHNYPKNCVAYTGTHDNNTSLGWLDSVDEEEREFVKTYLRLNDAEGYNWGMIKSVWASPADIAIVPMQDFLGLGSEGRVNTPSTLGGNWAWRVRGECINDWLAEIIYRYTKIYRRLNS